MKLPAPIFDAVKQHMPNHGAWHLARFREAWLPVPEREEWRAARVLYPHLNYLDQPGAGEQFLRFHRDMLDHFRAILKQHGSGFEFKPWPRIPSHLEKKIPQDRLAAAYGRILHLVQHGTLDELGAFLERTEYDFSFGSNLHTVLHGLIDAQESAEHPGDRSLIEASMADLSVAHLNEHFWTLHAWIDGLFTLWEKLHPAASGDANATGHADHSNGGGSTDLVAPGSPPASPPPSSPGSPPGNTPPANGHNHPTPPLPTVQVPAHHHVRPKI